MEQHTLHENVNILVDEKQKEILINPPGERFYSETCNIFKNATLQRIDDRDGIRYVVIGTVHYVNEYDEKNRNYEELLKTVPAELIKEKKGFFGGKYYTAKGRLSRELSTTYNCKYGIDYQIIVRNEIRSSTIESADDNNVDSNAAYRTPGLGYALGELMPYTAFAEAIEGIMDKLSSGKLGRAVLLKDDKVKAIVIPVSEYEKLVHSNCS